MTTTLTDNGVDTLTFTDLFDVSNEFHGGELGLAWTKTGDCWTLDLLGKVALGNMRQQVAISGSNTVNGTPTNGGFLAQTNSNIGVHQRDIFVWSPEMAARLSYHLNESISLSIGYTLMYWNRMALAGDQVNLTINGSQFNNGALSGTPDPTFQFRDTDFWAQSLDLGVLWQF